HPVDRKMNVRFKAGTVGEQVPHVQRPVQIGHLSGPVVGGYRSAHHPDGLLDLLSRHDLVIPLQGAFRQTITEYSTYKTIDSALAKEPLDQGTVTRHHGERAIINA